MVVRALRFLSLLLPAMSSLGEVGAGHTAQQFGFGAMKTSDGVMLFSVREDCTVAVRFRSKDISVPSPQPQVGAMIVMDGFPIQFVVLKMKEFCPECASSESDAAVLAKHIDWEMEYQAKILKAKLDQYRSFEVGPGKKVYARWGFDAPASIRNSGPGSTKRTSFVTTRARDSVLVLTGSVSRMSDARRLEAKLLKLAFFATIVNRSLSVDQLRTLALKP